MKKLITVTLILLMMAMTFVSVFAQEGEMRSIDVIVMDIREDLGISEDATIDPTLVDVSLLEELGDSVMEAYFNNTELHEEWDVYLGGENSETLQDVHLQLGADYLNGYPITMMSFMPFGSTGSFDSSRGFGMMGGYNQSNFGYGGMMGGYNQSNFGYGGMMGRYNQSNFGYGGMMGRYNQSNFGYSGMMGNGLGQNSFSLESAPYNMYRSYGMMNSFGFGGMFVGMIGFVLVIVLIVLMIARLFNKQHSSSYTENALTILKERYARGEINREEFLRSSSLIR